MNVWYNMDVSPPDSSFIGKQIIISVIPRYGEPYTEAIRWAGLKNYIPASWPIVTHWMPLPKPYKSEYITNKT